MYKPSDNRNCNNYWNQNNDYNKTPPHPSSDHAHRQTTSNYHQSEFNPSQQTLSRNRDTYDSSYQAAPFLNSNLDQYDDNTSRSMSKRNVTYPPPGQYLQSDYRNSTEMTNDTSKPNNAFPPPRPYLNSDYGQSQVGPRPPINSVCPPPPPPPPPIPSLLPSWNIGNSEADGLSSGYQNKGYRPSDHSQSGSNSFVQNNYGQSFSNDYDLSNQYKLSNNNAQEYGKYQEQYNNEFSSYGFKDKADMCNNSDYRNSQMNQYQEKTNNSSQSSFSDNQQSNSSNFGRVQNYPKSNVEYDSSNENYINNYTSPLESMEAARGNKPSFPSRTLTDSIPDNRRPLPVELDPDLPQEIVAQLKSSSCDICGVKLNSRGQAKMHYEGKPHCKKVKLAVKKLEENADPSTEDNLAEADLPPSKKKKTAVTDGSQLYCKCCDLSFTSSDHATQHYMGRNHQRVLHGLKALQAGYYNKETGKWQRMPLDPITSTQQLGLDGKDGQNDDAVKEKGKFFCELCCVSATSQDQLDGHLKGQRHIKKLKAAATKPSDPNNSEILESGNQDGSEKTQEGRSQSKSNKKKKAKKPAAKNKKEFLDKAKEDIKSLFNAAFETPPPLDLD